ncbi:DUF2165 family protein [Hyphococcus flavus]|uniref:DUF2165 family protein n=1 Tax=Hyphococcus flavus TaxID=1866326 RepID=A0AAE9ZB58_9PROT|nr:DUF2165 family protein [Hyphococcus flavus]WDI31279.1 DUF2165 family protein [Hyphococcus flavus]
MLRTMKVLLILSIAGWALLGAVENVVDWSGTTGAVGAVTSMATFEGGGDSWKATSNPVWIMAGSIFILVLKIIAGLLCLAGAAAMWSARASDAAAFQKSKSLALAGCGAAMFMLFAGWIVIAEVWYETWRSDVFRDLALNSAFRYCGMIGVMALFVGMRDEEA